MPCRSDPGALLGDATADPGQLRLASCGLHRRLRPASCSARSPPPCEQPPGCWEGPLCRPLVTGPSMPRRVVKLIRAIRKGWLKVSTEEEEEQEPKPYMLWADDGQGSARTAAGLAYIPAPKPTLPGHAESYNPPREYLPTEVRSLGFQGRGCCQPDAHVVPGMNRRRGGRGLCVAGSDLSSLNAPGSLATAHAAPRHLHACPRCAMSQPARPPPKHTPNTMTGGAGGDRGGL